MSRPGGHPGGVSRPSSLARLARLVVPVACPGCGLPDVRWCEACEAPWWEEPLRCETGAARLDGLDPPLPVWSVTALEGPVHGIVAAWKDAGRRDLDALLGAAARRAARALAAELDLPARLVVVPCPARPAHTRARGADLPGLLAREVAAGLRDEGHHAVPLSALRAAAGESRGAGDRARWRDAAPRLTVQAGRIRTPSPVLLVDDVVTTGATLARCARALAGSPLAVVGAFTLASAPGVHGPPAGALL